MDWWMIGLRVVHVGSGMAWFGGALIGGFFLFPTARALGAGGQPFMDQLMNSRRMGAFFPIVAALAVISGAALYWYDSSGLTSEWVTSPTGIAFAVGGLAAAIAFIGGMVLIGPSVAAETAVRNELAVSGGPPTPAQQERLDRADRRVRLANRIDLPLILVAGLMMAVARYL